MSELNNNEQSVLIMACLNDEVSRIAKEAAEKRGVEVVLLENKVIKDYIDAKNNSRNLDEFLKNTSNILRAKQNRDKLWKILTGGISPESSKEVIFTETDVVKKTTMSHSQAKALFNLLRVFGLLRFVEGGHKFVLNFSKEDCLNSIRKDSMDVVESMNDNILRFKNNLYSDDELSDDDKEKKYNEFKNKIFGSLHF